MNPLFKAAEMSNAAVALLHEGHSQEATSILREALALLRDLSHPDQLEELAGQADTATDCHMALVPLAVQLQDDQDKHMSKKPLIEDSEDSQNIFLHAMYLDGRISNQDRELVCGAALYNMALAYHSLGRLEASCKEVKTNDKTSKALYLYQMVCQVSLELSSPYAEMLVLCSLNNSAHLFSVQFQRESVLRCADAMIDALTGPTLIASDPNHEEAYSFFFMNAMYYKQKHDIAPMA